METITIDPIFIISNPRSGSTLLRSILSAHSKVAIPHEFPLIQELVKYQAKYKLSEIEILISYLYQFNHFKDWNIDKNELNIELNKLNFFSIQSIVRVVYSFFLHPKIKNKIIWGEKNIGNIGYIEDISRFFPTAKFIFLVRDPRAVVSSIKKRNWLFSQYKGCERRYIKSLYGAVKLWQDGNDIMHRYILEDKLSIHTIRYEDLVNNTKATLITLCQYLELELEDSMLQHHLNKESLLKIPTKRVNNNHENISKPIDTSIASKYKKELSKKEIGLIEYLLINEMQDFGYIPIIDKLSLIPMWVWFSKMNDKLIGTFVYTIYQIKKKLIG